AGDGLLVARLLQRFSEGGQSPENRFELPLQRPQDIRRGFQRFALVFQALHVAYRGAPVQVAEALEYRELAACDFALTQRAVLLLDCGIAPGIRLDLPAQIADVLLQRGNLRRVVPDKDVARSFVYRVPVVFLVALASGLHLPGERHRPALSQEPFQLRAAGVVETPRERGLHPA